MRLSASPVSCFPGALWEKYQFFAMFEDFKNNIRKIPFAHMGTVSRSVPVKSSCRHKDTSSDFWGEKKKKKSSFAWKKDRKSCLGPKSLSLVKSAQGCVLSWCHLVLCTQIKLQ